MQENHADCYPASRSFFITAIAAMSLIAACDAPEAVTAKGNRHACDEKGRLVAELHGGIRASLDWQADVLACEGMPRPNGEGARLRLSGPIGAEPDTRTLAFILALPDLEEGGTGAELATSVTLMEEGSGRFFATRDASGCWTDVQAHDPLGTQSRYVYRISGILYCVAPLAELNGGSSITLTELAFTGRVSWKSPQ